MTKFLCGECIHNSDKGGGCLIPKNLGYVDNCNRYLPKDKPIVQTNEEHIHSLNTEQLAEWLANVINTNPCGYLLDCNECSLNDKCKEDDYPTSAEAWVEWLKQQHTNKE